MADYISREANGDDYVRRADIVEKFMNRLPSISVNYLCKIADEVPPADVRPVVRGKWIKQNPSNELDGDYYCSACGYGIDIADGSITPFDVGFKFCPNCGADMRPEGGSDG